MKKPCFVDGNFLICFIFTLVFYSSIHKIGLLVDPMVNLFVSTNLESVIKSPLMNRGTFIRTKIIDKMVEHHSIKGNTIVSLGAGYDTRFYRLNISNRYIEVDLPQVLRKKKKILINQLELPELLPLDLNEGFEPLKALNLSSGVLFVAECCLMYLDSDQCERLIEWMSTIPNSSLIIFDPIVGNDSFGKVFIDNLKNRNINVQHLKMYPTIESCKTRLEKYWNKVQVNYMNQTLLSHNDQSLMEKMTELDEVEEWNLFCNHYFFAYCNSSSKSSLSLS